jgi:hypothetical protein
VRALLKLLAASVPHFVLLDTSTRRFKATDLPCTRPITLHPYSPPKGSPIAQSVHCLTTGCTAGVRTPTEAEDFSSNPCVQTGSGAHLAYCTVGTGGSFPGRKARPGRDADHSPPSNAEVKKEQELYLRSPKCASMERNGTTLPFFFAFYKLNASYTIQCTLCLSSCLKHVTFKNIGLLFKFVFLLMTMVKFNNKVSRSNSV